jgi:predicted lipoprotein with Yx(FWY)xxD motif
MIDSATPQTAQPRRRRATALKAGTVAVALALAATFAALALASSSVSVDSASNSKLGERILVNSSGRTLYVLSPETSAHLLCKSSECLKSWPPLKASSASKVKLASGVHGKVGILHRSDGVSQVMLNGHPLYFFAEDKARGEVNGQNLKSFGGTWHVLTPSGSPSSKAAASAPASSTSTPSTTPTSTSTPGSSGGSAYEY